MLIGISIFHGRDAPCLNPNLNEVSHFAGSMSLVRDLFFGMS